MESALLLCPCAGLDTGFGAQVGKQMVQSGKIKQGLVFKKEKTKTKQ